MQRLDLIGFAATEQGDALLLLRTEDGERVVPIGIGPIEAGAIAARLGGLRPERPMTHDLLSTIVHEIGAEVTQVEITELRDSAFHALITLATPSGAVGVDARPSDAIALAVRADAPIFASDQVIEEGSVELPDEPEQVVEEFPEQVVEEFRAFLDEVSPDEFARRDGEQPDAGDVA